MDTSQYFDEAVLPDQPVQAFGGAERPKINSDGSLSPRGDWRIPSESSAATWHKEFDAALPLPRPLGLAEDLHLPHLAPVLIRHEAKRILDAPTGTPYALLADHA